MRASGTFTNTIQYLSNKVLKVIFMIRRRSQTESVNSKLLLKLFDTCVKPVLLYGSELRSVFHIDCSKILLMPLTFHWKKIMKTSCLKKKSFEVL